MDNPIMEVHYSEYEVLFSLSLSLFTFSVKIFAEAPKILVTCDTPSSRPPPRKGEDKTEDLSRPDRARSFPLPTFSLPFYFLFRHLEEETEFLVSSRALPLSPSLPPQQTCPNRTTELLP